MGRRGPLSPDRRIFFGQGRGGVRSRELAARVTASFGSRGGSSTADLLFPLLFPPTLISVTPNTGSPAGGDVVDLAGMNFQNGATVTFDGVAATGVTFVSSSHITATTPAHAAGAVDVVVTNPDLQFSTLVNGFTYFTAPLIDEALAGSTATAHVYNPGTGLVDLAGNAWTQVGTVPLVASQNLGFVSGVSAAGFGPFSALNYFQLGAGPGVLNFADNFLITMIFRLNVGTTGVVIDEDGAPTFRGYSLKATSSAGNVNIAFQIDNGGIEVSGGVAQPDGFVIVSVGMSGTTALTKINKNAGVTAAGHFVDAAPTAPARLGITNALGTPLVGTLIEMCAWAVAPSQAMMLNIATSVMG